MSHDLRLGSGKVLETTEGPKVWKSGQGFTKVIPTAVRMTDGSHYTWDGVTTEQIDTTTFLVCP